MKNEEAFYKDKSILKIKTKMVTGCFRCLMCDKPISNLSSVNNILILCGDCENNSNNDGVVASIVKILKTHNK